MSIHCANTACSSGEFDQPGGSIWLMELEPSRDEPIGYDDNGFPINSRPHKYFWLCVECSRLFVLIRWTEAGIALAPKPNSAQHDGGMNAETQGLKPPIRIFASANIEEEFREAV